MESEELEIRRSMSAKSLRLINLKSAVAIGAFSFYKCKNLLSVEFGDRLEIISGCAFALCISLQHLKLPSIITIGLSAFSDCTKLIDVELSERIESIWARAFDHCQSLQRIAIPLKEHLLREYLPGNAPDQFDFCYSSNNQCCWGDAKSRLIKWWLASVLNKLNEYKARHCRYVKEAMSLLELALWKAKLTVGEAGASSGSVELERQSKKIKVDGKVARKEKRLLCSADIVIKNVLPFLELES